MYLGFIRMRPEAQLPLRENPSDAGADVYFCPEDGKAVVIPPHWSVKLQTGLKVSLPHGFALIVENRSGVASKKVIKVGAKVIDPGYKGELIVNLHNDGNELQTINPGDKIAQLLMVPVIHFRPIEFANEESLFSEEVALSKRGEGGFGSTGA